MSFIDIKNIWQEYGDHVVLERINLQVKEGEFCSMVGASGCGKSTFLRLLLGQEKPTRGEITLDGTSRWRRSRTAAAAWCFSVIRFFRTSTCWITSPLASNSRRHRCLVPAVCRQETRRARTGAADAGESRAGARAE